MSNAIDLFAKFSAVEVVSADRISETDKLFCEKHQAAYEAAVTSYRELIVFWEDIAKTQREHLGEREGNIPYFDYLSTREGAYISEKEVKAHIESLHMSFINHIAWYFEKSYHLTLDAYSFYAALMPMRPSDDADEDAYVEDVAAYHEKLQTMALRYQDILDLIFKKMDGRSFSEQAMFELKESCHKAAWNLATHKARYELKKDTIRFLREFSSYTYPRSYSTLLDWKLEDKMKSIMKGVGHFETGRYEQFPEDIEDLLKGKTTLDVMDFSDCAKVKQLKCFKNGNVNLKFVSAAYAQEFIDEYLGSVA